MISLIVILFVIWNNSENPFFSGFDVGAMVGVLSVDITILYFIDKFIF